MVVGAVRQPNSATNWNHGAGLNLGRRGLGQSQNKFSNGFSIGMLRSRVHGQLALLHFCKRKRRNRHPLSHRMALLPWQIALLSRIQNAGRGVLRRSRVGGSSLQTKARRSGDQVVRLRMVGGSGPGVRLDTQRPALIGNTARHFQRGDYAHTLATPMVHCLD